MAEPAVVHPFFGQIPGALNIIDRELIGDASTIGDWAATTNDATTLEAALNHVLGTKSVRFDKANGAANGVIAAVESSFNPIDASRFTADARVLCHLHVTTIANIADAFIRIGTDASNYAEFVIDDAAITVDVWQEISIKLSEQTVVAAGTGLNLAAITYVAVGVTFDLETNTLANIEFDQVAIVQS